MDAQQPIKCLQGFNSIEMQREKNVSFKACMSLTPFYCEHI